MFTDLRERSRKRERGRERERERERERDVREGEMRKKHLLFASHTHPN